MREQKKNQSKISLARREVLREVYGRSMGGVTGGVTGGLEKTNSLIIMYLAKNRGGLAKRMKICNSQLIIHNSQFSIRLSQPPKAPFPLGRGGNGPQHKP